MGLYVEQYSVNITNYIEDKISASTNLFIQGSLHQTITKTNNTSSNTSEEN